MTSVSTPIDAVLPAVPFVFQTERYCLKVLSEIGITAAGVKVYRASVVPVEKPLSSDTFVAVQFIRESSLDEDVGRNLACLSVGDICPIITAGNGYVCNILMPINRLTSLRTIMRIQFKNGLPENFIAFALKQTLNNLHQIHGRNQVHKKITAGSILCDWESKRVILPHGASTYERYDEDVAANEASSSSCLDLSSIIQWAAAPEVYERGHDDASHTKQSDVWLIGILAIELAYGSLKIGSREDLEVLIERIRFSHRLPNKGENDMDGDTDESVNKIEKKSFSKDFGRFVANCLNSDPKKRPDAGQLYWHKFLRHDVGFLEGAEIIERKCTEKTSIKVEAILMDGSGAFKSAENAIKSEDLLCRLLSYLPAETLISWKLVCHRFKDVISKPYTHSLWKERQKSSGFFINLRSRILFVPLTTNGKHPVIPAEIVKEDVQMLSCCNGLVLLQATWTERSRRAETYYICNPLTRHFIDIETPNCCSEKYRVYSMSLAAETRNYKVISVCSNMENLKIEINSSDTNKWKSNPVIYHCSYFTNYFPYTSGFYANGSVYWPFVRCEDSPPYFNIETELLGSLPLLPRTETGEINYFGTCNGDVNLITCKERTATLYMLDDYRWCAKYIVPVDSLAPEFRKAYVQVLCVVDQFLIVLIGGELYKYNFTSGECKKVYELELRERESYNLRCSGYKAIHPYRASLPQTGLDC